MNQRWIPVLVLLALTAVTGATASVGGAPPIVYFLHVNPPESPRPLSVGGAVGSTIAILPTDTGNRRITVDPTNSDIGYDGNCIAGTVQKVLARLVSESGAFEEALLVHPSALIADPENPEVRAADYRLESRLESFSVRLAPPAAPTGRLAAFKAPKIPLTVDNPAIDLTVSARLVDRSGTVVWQQSVDASATGQSTPNYKTWNRSGEKDRFQERLSALGISKYENLSDALLALTAHDMATEAVATVIDGLTPGLEGALAGRAGPRQASARSGSIRELIDVAPVPFRVRGRTWSGVQGAIRDDREDATAGQGATQLRYEIVVDGELYDANLLRPVRTDTRGKLEKDTFNFFNEKFELDLPLGTHEVLVLADQDSEWHQLHTLMAANAPEIGTTGRRLMAHTRSGETRAGVLHVHYETMAHTNMPISAFRNIYKVKNDEGGLLGKALKKALVGGTYHYEGAWEIVATDEDPFALLELADHEDSRFKPLVAEEPSKRVAACKALKESPDAAAVPVLAEVLTLDSHQDVREHALKALIEIDDDRALFFIVKTLLWDGNKENRETARDYLVKNKKQGAVPYLEDFYYEGSWYGGRSYYNVFTHQTVNYVAKVTSREEVAKILKKITGVKYD